MKCTILLSALLLTTPFLSSCADGQTDAYKDAAFAALWSSETDKTVIVTYNAEGNQIGAVESDFLGIQPSPSQGLIPHGGAFYGLALGDAQRNTTHVVEFSDCELTGYRVAEPAPQALAVTDDAFYTTNTLNGAAHVTRHDRSDATSREVIYAGRIGSQLALTGKGLAVITEDETATAAVVHLFDADTLEELWRLDLPADTGFGPDRLAVGDELLLPSPLDIEGDSPQDVLIRIDLTEQTVKTMTLGAALPYTLREADGVIYVGHTFMNPSFGEMADNRTVTVIDGDTVTQHEVGVGLTRIETAGDRLYVYGELADGSVHLETYRLPDFTLESTIDLKPQAGRGHRYPAGFVLLD